MTDTQQKCFLAVSEHLSFSKAAEVLYVSQPAVSKNISSLETELGLPLFIRQGKNVALTRAGEIFRDFLREYDQAYKSTLVHMLDLERNIHSGSVTIGCDTTWNAAHFYTRLHRHFSIHHPDIKLDVLGLEPDIFIQALRNREADAVIMYACDTKKLPDIVSVPFISIGCGFLSSSLLSPDISDASELGDQTFLVVDSATEKSGKLIYGTMFMDFYKSINPSPKLRHCRNLAAAQLAVSSGKGIMFADSWTSAVSNSEFSYYPLDKKIDLCIAYLASNTGTHIQFFAEEAVKVFTGHY